MREGAGVGARWYRDGAPGSTRAMHIVLIGWLFVIGVMALTLSSPLAGVAFFAGLGVAPAALLVWLAARRSRALVLEQHVHAADDRDAQSDQ
jgi:hypothetical protein